jgi:hypothetical protein
MAITQADVETFEQTLISRKGAVSATFADQEITFESYEASQRFLAFLKRQVAGGSISRYVATDKDV